MISWILNKFKRKDYPPKIPYNWKKYHRRVEINNAIRDLAKELQKIKEKLNNLTEKGKEDEQNTRPRK